MTNKEQSAEFVEKIAKEKNLSPEEIDLLRMHHQSYHFNEHDGPDPVHKFEYRDIITFGGSQALREAALALSAEHLQSAHHRWVEAKPTQISADGRQFGFTPQKNLVNRRGKIS